MNPLELEIYHQIKNVIGVNPTFYEYLFMVDADTTALIESSGLRVCLVPQPLHFPRAVTDVLKIV